MVTETVHVSQAGTVVTGKYEGDLALSQAGTFVLANFATRAVDVSQAVGVVVANSSSDIRVSQTGVMLLARGRKYNPRLGAFTFTLDGHEFYVLRLGESKTLVYDLTTGQWSWWSSSRRDTWRAAVGTNWYTAKDVAIQHGSNVVLGDDTYGHLWVLDPEQAYDNNAASVESASYFPRSAVGQLTTRERNFFPLNQIYLTADRDYRQDFVVRLYHSTDAGKSFVDCGGIKTQAGNANQEFVWRSLGLMRPPGSLFRIEDDGAFARIDSMDVT